MPDGWACSARPKAEWNFVCLFFHLVASWIYAAQTAASQATSHAVHALLVPVSPQMKSKILDYGWAWLYGLLVTSRDEAQWVLRRKDGSFIYTRTDCDWSVQARELVVRVRSSACVSSCSVLRVLSFHLSVCVSFRLSVCALPA